MVNINYLVYLKLSELDKTSKILVTGGNGLLGSYIIRYLIKQEYTEITALVREEGKLDLLPVDILPKIEIVRGDILDFGLIDQLTILNDFVIHTAAEVHFDARHAKQLYKTNIDGTTNIADCCLDNDVKKLVYISSTAALGRLYDGQEIDESTMWDYSALNTQYAVSKHYGELEVWRAHEEGLNVGILNPSLIISPGFFNKSSAGIYSRLYKGLKYFPTGTNGVVDVRDAAKLCILLLEHDSNSLKIIACADNLKYEKIFSEIATNFNKPIPTISVESHLRMLLQLIYKVKSLFGYKADISKASLLNSSMDFYYNNSLSKTLFDYQYTDVDITISEACEAFQIAKKEQKDYCTLDI